MLGIIILIVGIFSELVYTVIKMRKKRVFKREKHIFNLAEFAVFCLLVSFNIIKWSFRWYLLCTMLLLRSIIAVIMLLKKKSEKDYKISRVILPCLGSLLLFIVVLAPAILFPQREPIPVSGSYGINTVTYTWEDASRLETFKTDGSHRYLTIQFWYPKSTGNKKFPLVIFSHGAFGVRCSNYSTFTELASNGYVVCSIDHTYHSFFTQLTDGKIITVNPEFMNSVFEINKDGITEDEIFKITRPWMELRCDDINFILDTIEEKADKENTDPLFSQIDLNKIGIMGHSLGGAASVTVGRQRDDIDAVIDLDGTMLGEELACSDNRYTIYADPYPVPLLCIDTTGHYEEGLTYGNLYVNNVILQNALDAREVHFDGAEHMNFTDLPYRSPFLASLLGTGNIDITGCIKTMNAVILNYYNHYLKDSEELNIKESY